MERRLKRLSRERSSVYSGVCLHMCVFLYPGYLPPQKAFNGAFMSPSMAHSDVLNALYDTVWCPPALEKLFLRHRLQRCDMAALHFNQITTGCYDKTEDASFPCARLLRSLVVVVTRLTTRSRCRLPVKPEVDGTSDS